MSYRDQITEIWGDEVGNVVGYGLDRLNRIVWDAEQSLAAIYYLDNRERFQEFSIGARRQLVADYIETGEKFEGFL